MISKIPHQSRPLAVACSLACAVLAFAAGSINAATIVKTNNADNLNLGSSWVGNVPPTSADVAQWDATVTGANTTALGASAAWLGIKVTSPGGLVTISDAVNQLTNGASGIDLSAASQNLALDSSLVLGGNQTWNIPAGRTLTLSRAPSPAASLFTVTKTGSGLLQLSGGNDRLPLNSSLLSIGTNQTSTVNLGGNSLTINNLNLVQNNTAASNFTFAVTSGSLTVSNNSDMIAGQNCVFDLSGLSAFTFGTDYSKTWRILPHTGVTATTNTVLLAKSGPNGGVNTFNANLVQAGGAGGSSANDNHAGVLRLGTTNIFNAVTFQVGGFNGRGRAQFQSGLTAPALIARGTNGASSAIQFFKVGETSSGVRSGEGVLDLTGGTIDVLATNVQIGRMIAGASIADTSTLIMPAGSIDTVNLTLAEKTGIGTPTITSTLAQNGGTVKAQLITMGKDAGTNTASIPILKPTYNLNGGTLFAGSIVAGGGYFSNASVRVINWTNGIIRNYDAATDLAITSVTVAAPTNGSRYLTIDTARTATINASFTQVTSNASPVVINGAGTVDLQGTSDNAFLGLNISNGIVVLNKTSSGSVHALGADTVLNGGTLRLSGSGGDQIVNTRSLTINSGSFDLGGQTETIAGLNGAGSVGSTLGVGTLTLSTPTGSNYLTAATLNDAFDLAKSGLGKQTLNGTDSRTGGANTITAGTLEVGNGGATGSLTGDTTVNTGGTLAFNRSGTLNFAGNITGAGDVAQNGGGTLILSGSDSHTGNTFINTGTLQLPVSATTVGGTTVIVASGATFNTTPAGGGFFLSPGQVLKGAGLVQGDFILGTGSTLSGTLTNTGSVTGADATATNAPGGFLTSGTLRINGSYTNGPATLVYDLANNTAIGGGTNDLLVVGGNLDFSTPCTLVIRQLGAGLASGTYVLATYGTFSGSTANVTLPTSPRYTFGLAAVSGQLRLTVTGTPATLAWRGDGVSNPWDEGITTDWFNTGSSSFDKFFSGDNVVFDDSGATNPAVDIQAQLFPASVTVNASANYVFNGAGSIEGPQGMTKSGSGTLTINTVNGFVGPVNANGGTISVSTLATAGTASPLGAGSSLNFNGGALQYTGPALGAGGFTRDITLGASGGTIDQQSSGGIFLFITNRITGAGSLTKVGAQQLILGDSTSGTGSNDFAGVTYVNNGNLQIRHANALGTTAGKTVVTAPGSLAAQGITTPIPENIDLASGTLSAGAGAACEFGGTITVVSNSPVGGSSGIIVSGPIVGGAQLEKIGGGTLTLLGNNTYSGGTLISAGTVQLGTNGTSGWLGVQPAGVALTNNGTINFNRADTNTFAGSITGTGGLSQNGSGTTILSGTNSFDGNVAVNTGVLRVASGDGLGSSLGTTTVAGNPATGVLGFSGNITVPENIILAQRSITNGGIGAQLPHVVNFSGNNALTGLFNLAAGGNYWGINSEAGTLTINTLSNGILSTFTRPIYLQGAGNGVINQLLDITNWTQVIKYGAGSWTLQGDQYIGRGVDVREGTLVINTNVFLGQPGFEGPGASVVSGGSLQINVDGTLNGSLRIAGGQLAGNGTVNAAVTNTAGSISPGVGAGVIGTLTIAQSLIVDGGSFSVDLNKSLAQSNDVINAYAGTAVTGGSVSVANVGPALVAGDRFYLFPGAVTGGDLLAISGPAGVTWTNDLALDGSIAVLSIAPTINTNPCTLTNVLSGSTLTFTWPATHIGWVLQTQTNSRSVGLKAATNFWFDVPGSSSVTTTNFPVNKNDPTVFFRLKLP